MIDQAPRGQTGLERVLLHIVQVVTVTGIIGGYVAMGELRTSNAVLQSEFRALSERLEDFRTSFSNAYTERQAQSDLAPIYARQVDHEARLRALEKAIIPLR